MMWNDLKPAWRFPVLFLGMFSLVIGVLAGLGRLGIPVPVFALNQAAYHGILMVPAFFGTVIGLERAVAIGQRWSYTAPLLTGIGGGALLIGASPSTGLALIVAGNMVFMLASIRILRIQPAIHNLILLAGAISLLVGDWLLLSSSIVNESLYWWMSFLLLTIAGERMELSRLILRNRYKRLLLAVLAMVPVAGAITITLLPGQTGLLFFCTGMAGIAIWLLLFDIARRTIFQTGLTRFTAICMIAGYVWLLISALSLMGLHSGWDYVSRDSALHSFFLGFVFSMVIGHALIIFPAVTGLRIPYSPAIYLPFVLLQLSLLSRVAASITNQADMLSTAAMFNAIALALFIIFLLWRMVRARIVSSEIFNQGHA